MAKQTEAQKAQARIRRAQKNAAAIRGGWVPMKGGGRRGPVLTREQKRAKIRAYNSRPEVLAAKRHKRQIERDALIKLGLRRIRTSKKPSRYDNYNVPRGRFEGVGNPNVAALMERAITNGEQLNRRATVSFLEG